MSLCCRLNVPEKSTEKALVSSKGIRLHSNSVLVACHHTHSPSILLCSSPGTATAPFRLSVFTLIAPWPNCSAALYSFYEGLASIFTSSAVARSARFASGSGVPQEIVFIATIAVGLGLGDRVMRRSTRLFVLCIVGVVLTACSQQGTDPKTHGTAAERLKQVTKPLPESSVRRTVYVAVYSSINLEREGPPHSDCETSDGHRASGGDGQC